MQSFGVPPREFALFAVSGDSRQDTPPGIVADIAPAKDRSFGEMILDMSGAEIGIAADSGMVVEGTAPDRVASPLLSLEGLAVPADPRTLQFPPNSGSDHIAVTTTFTPGRIIGKDIALPEAMGTKPAGTNDLPGPSVRSQSTGVLPVGPAIENVSPAVAESTDLADIARAPEFAGKRAGGRGLESLETAAGHSTPRGLSGNPTGGSATDSPPAPPAFAVLRTASSGAAQDAGSGAAPVASSTARADRSGNPDPRGHHLGRSTHVLGAAGANFDALHNRPGQQSKRAEAAPNAPLSQSLQDRSFVSAEASARGPTPPGGAPADRAIPETTPSIGVQADRTGEKPAIAPRVDSMPVPSFPGLEMTDTKSPIRTAAAMPGDTGDLAMDPPITRHDEGARRAESAGNRGEFEYHRMPREPSAGTGSAVPSDGRRADPQRSERAGGEAAPETPKPSVNGAPDGKVPADGGRAEPPTVRNGGPLGPSPASNVAHPVGVRRLDETRGDETREISAEGRGDSARPPERRDGVSQALGVVAAPQRTPAVSESVAGLPAPHDPEFAQSFELSRAIGGESVANGDTFGIERTGGSDPRPDPSQPVRPGDLRPANIQHMLDALKRGPGQFDVTLSPEELGRLTLTVGTQDGTITVALSAERPETLELIRRHIDILAHEARAAGFSDLEFSFGGEHGGDPGDRERGDGPDVTAAPAVGKTNEESSPAATPDGTGLDIRL